VIDFRLDDRLTLAKAHPCGAQTWRIVRLGADIGIVCDGCGHKVMIERRELERRVRNVEHATEQSGQEGAR